MQRSMRFSATSGTQREDKGPGAQSETTQFDRPVAPESRWDDDYPTKPGPDRGGRDDAPRAGGPLARVMGITGVTVIEALSIYVWLRLYESGHPWWALLALVAGQAVETDLLRRFVDRGGVKRWGPPAKASVGHLRKVQRRLEAAGNIEIALWLLWLACAHALSQPIAAVGLLVAMHFKHQVEVAAVLDTPYRTGLFAIKGLFGSAMEVAGAAACLALILDGQLVLGAVVLALALLIEHWLLINVLIWEITVRDVRVPRDPRWRAPKRPLPAVAAYATSHYEPFWRLLQRSAPLHRALNRRAINSLIDRVEPRPNPLSTLAPYTSWASLTDRSYSSRHLPPAPAVAKRSPEHGPPTSTDVASSFMRDEMIECPKTTVLFSFFAQWFTDGILRTERDDAKTVRDTRKNESNHDIDLAQLYGLHRPATEQLRCGHGLLKSQIIDGEEYPPYYYAPSGPGGELEPKSEFDELMPPLLLKRLTYEQQRTLFAMGSDTRNIGFIALNVLFLREHNRIARRLGDEYPDWDSDRVFETARNILTVLLLRIVIEDYINHVNPNYFEFRLTPGSFPNEPWFRPNWVAIEFNLLYRWHCLVPSTFHLGGRHLAIPEMLSDTSVLTSAGLGQFLAAASSQPAGRMSLFNTDRFLVEVAEKPSIEQARAAELASYNDYRRLCRHPPAASFAEISSDPEVQRQLAGLYPGGVEDVEFYVGLFAEDIPTNGVLPPLMMSMVALDAFSQALTNPLLAPRVFNEATFSAAGMEIIENTSRLSDLVERNVPRQSEPYFVSMTRRGYKRA